jgi:hypothetical protein
VPSVPCDDDKHTPYIVTDAVIARPIPKGLCNWAAAMCKYHEVAKVVEPKIATLRAAEAEFKIAMKEKNAAEERMAKVQAKLDEMQAQFDAAMAQKQVGCWLC